LWFQSDQVVLQGDCCISRLSVTAITILPVHPELIEGFDGFVVQLRKTGSIVVDQANTDIRSSNR
jgi:hypothetical protein